MRDGSKWGWAFALVAVLLFALGYGIGYTLARPLPAALWSRWIRLFSWR
jgi:hypothetical protein